MINAKEEFLEHVNGKEVLCAYIYDTMLYPSVDNAYILKRGYTEEDLNNFLSSLDFEYDDSVGFLVFSGNIWYADGTWSERFEHEELEWWVHVTYPDIPEVCKA